MGNDKVSELSAQLLAIVSEEKIECKALKNILVEIVQNTVNHYKLNSRSVTWGGCAYQSYSNGIESRCAVGRFMDADTIERLSYENKLAYPIGSLQTDLPLFAKYFVDDYDINLKRFWEAVQNLHDNSFYWDKNDFGGNSLTLRGKSYVEFLIAEIENNAFTKKSLDNAINQ